MLHVLLFAGSEQSPPCQVPGSFPQVTLSLPPCADAWLIGKNILIANESKSNARILFHLLCPISLPSNALDERVEYHPHHRKGTRAQSGHDQIDQPSAAQLDHLRAYGGAQS